MNPSQNPQGPQQIELTLGQPQQLQLALEQPQWTPEELEKARRFEDLCAQALRRYQEAKQVSSSPEATPEASLTDETPSLPSASPSSIKLNNSPEYLTRLRKEAMEELKDWVAQGHCQMEPGNEILDNKGSSGK